MIGFDGGEGLLGLVMLTARGGGGAGGLWEIAALILALLVGRYLTAAEPDKVASEVLDRLRFGHSHSRTISHKTSSTPFGQFDDDVGGVNNRLLQKAVMFKINESASKKLWNRTELSLASASASDARTGDRRDKYAGDKDEKAPEVSDYSVVKISPVNRWVTVSDGEEGTLRFRRYRDERDSEDGKRSTRIERYELRASGATPDAAKALVDGYIDDALTSYARIIDRSKDLTRYMFVPYRTPDSSDEEGKSGIKFKKYPLSDEKTFDTLYHPDKELILRLVDNFQNKTNKFAIRGYPYKLGFLLHGPPGTGKTSFIKALASHTDRHIVSVSLEKIRTNQELLSVMHDRVYEIHGEDSSFRPSFDKIVFVMEDIDAAASVVQARGSGAALAAEQIAARVLSNSQESGNQAMPAVLKEEDRLNLAGLLNALDGVLDSPGRIVVMTTNNPEKLDQAIIRPGRVNMRVHMANIAEPEAKQMLRRYFLCGETDISDHEDLLREVLRRGLSPASLEAVCGQHDRVQDAISAIAETV